MPSIKSLLEFDAAKYLDGEAAVAAYLTDILEANDPALLAVALGEIARARGMSEIAKASGLTREALYKALRPNAQPRFDPMASVAAHVLQRPLLNHEDSFRLGQNTETPNAPLSKQHLLLWPCFHFGSSQQRCDRSKHP